VPRGSASGSTSVTRANSSVPVVSITGRSSSTAAGAAAEPSSGRRSSSSSWVLNAGDGEGDDGVQYVPGGEPVCRTCEYATNVEKCRVEHLQQAGCGSACMCAGNWSVQLDARTDAQITIIQRMVTAVPVC
jgi:hypothetical protein